MDEDIFAAISKTMLARKPAQQSSELSSPSAVKREGGRETRVNRGASASSTSDAVLGSNGTSRSIDVINIDDDDGFEVKEKEKPTHKRKRKQDDVDETFDFTDEVATSRLSVGGTGRGKKAREAAAAADPWADLLKEAESNGAGIGKSGRPGKSVASVSAAGAALNAQQFATGKDVQDALARAAKVLAGDETAMTDLSRRQATKQAVNAKKRSAVGASSGAGAKAEIGDEEGGEAADATVIGIIIPRADKTKLMYKFKMTLPFSLLYKKYAKEASVAIDRIILKYQGTVLGHDQTPEEADWDLDEADTEEGGLPRFTVDVSHKT